MTTVRDIKNEFEQTFPNHTEGVSWPFNDQERLLKFRQKLNELGARAIDRVHETHDIDSLVELSEDECRALREEMRRLSQEIPIATT